MAMLNWKGWQDGCFLGWVSGGPPPAPPSDVFLYGGGGKGDSLDELALFKRLQRKLKAGVSLAQALKEEDEDAVETVRETLPRKVGKKAEVRPRDPRVLQWLSARVEHLEARVEQIRREQEDEDEAIMHLLVHLL